MLAAGGSKRLGQPKQLLPYGSGRLLGHVLDTSRLAPADFVARTRSQVRGAGARLWALAASLVVGILLAVAMAPTFGPWVATGGRGG